ncbi:hypothetical protein HRbin10_00716 [bacterium HR10]|nr:hypothetical protein HRbin10_00716 [bacterium HR10]
MTQQGKRLAFKPHGLYNAELVFADTETGSVWSLTSGEAMDGPLAGQRLNKLAVVQTTWAKWKQLHPDTLIVSNRTPHQAHYKPFRWQPRQLSPVFERTLTHRDERLGRMELVLAVALGDERKAYPLSTLKQAGGVVNDVVGGVPIVVFYDPQTNTAAAYERTLGKRVLRFENADRQGERLEAVDTATRSRWNLAGRAESGRWRGEQLQPVSAHTGAWYAWAAYFPDTKIYTPAARQRGRQK